MVCQACHRFMLHGILLELGTCFDGHFKPCLMHL